MTNQMHLEKITKFKQRYLNLREQLLEIGSKLEKECLKTSLEEIGANKCGNEFRYDKIGDVEYFPIFLTLGDELKIYAGTNCHYITPSHIKKLLPRIENFLNELEQKKEKLFEIL